MRKKIIRYSGEKLILDKIKVARYKKLKMQVAKIMQELDPLEEQIKDELKEYMENKEKKTLKIEGLIASFKPSYVRTMFDSKQFKEDDRSKNSHRRAKHKSCKKNRCESFHVFPP